jgi:hypothetical protein
MAITRKAFLVQWLPLGGATWALPGCGGGGGDDGGSAMPPPPSGGQCGVTISVNHGHVLNLPLVDLDSTTDRSYDIQGSATHTHSVTFSAAQLAMLKAGQMVSVTSTAFSDGHNHLLTERCT